MRLFFLLPCVALVACGGHPPPPASALLDGNGTDPVTGVEQPSQPGDPTITVVVPGVEPRKALRYELARGATQEGEFEMTAGMTVAGQKTSAMPPFLLTTAATVKDHAADGSSTLGIKIVKLDLGGADDPAVRAAFQQQLEGLKRVEGEETVSARGFVRDVKTTAPADAGPLVLRMGEQLHRTLSDSSSVAFPNASIGDGARWDVSRTTTTQGMKVEQVTHFTLVSRQGTRCKVTFTATMSAPPQALPNPEESATAELTSFAGTGEGSYELELSKPLPETSEAKYTAKIGVKLTKEGRSEVREMTMTGDFRLHPPKGPAAGR